MKTSVESKFKWLIYVVFIILINVELLHTQNLSYDSTFATNGTLNINAPTKLSLINSLKKADSTGYFAFGTANLGLSFYFAMAKIKLDGSVDKSFGNQGFFEKKYPEYNFYFHDLNVTKGGKYLVAGQIFKPDLSDFKIKILCFLPNGEPDMDFAEDGEFTFPEGTNNSDRIQINELNNNSIFITKHLVNWDVDESYLIKLNSAGELDSLFGIDGVLPIYGTPQHHRIAFAEVATQNEQKLIVQYNGFNPIAGETQNLVRLNEDGSIDTTFAKNGYFDLGKNNQPFKPQILILEDSSIILCHLYFEINSEVPNGLMLRKFDKNGNVFKEFGKSGIFMTSQFTENLIETYFGIDQKKDGGFIVVLNSKKSSILVEITPEGILNKSFGINGIQKISKESDMHVALGLNTIDSNKLIMFGNIHIPGYVFLSQFKVVDATNSFYEINKNIPIIYYPNPTNNSLTLSTNNNFVSIDDIQIYSSSGQLVKTIDDGQKIGTNLSNISIDVMDLSAGNYLILLNTTIGSTVVKFTKI